MFSGYSCFRLCLTCVCVCFTENRTGETDPGEEPAQPAEAENVSHCLVLMSEGLQRSKPEARAAAGVSQIHFSRLPPVLYISSHRVTSFTVGTPVPGFVFGP